MTPFGSALCRNRTEISASASLVKVINKRRFAPRRSLITRACCPASDAEAVNLLPILIRQDALQNCLCTAYISAKDCKLKTISLPRVKTRELQKITAQDVFWREYLGVAKPEWRLWQRRLPAADAHETQLLLAAIPAEKADACAGIVQQAGGRLQKLGIACFEYFSYLKHLRHGGCFVMAAGNDPYIIGAGTFGVRLRTFGDGSLSARHTHSLSIEERVSMITEILSEHAEGTSVSVEAAVNTDDEIAVWSDLKRYLPNHYKLTVRNIHAWSQIRIGVAADVNFLPAKRVLSPRHRYALAAGSLISAFLVSGYVHQTISEKNELLYKQFNDYQILKEGVEYKRQLLSKLTEEATQLRDLFAEVRVFTDRQKRTLKLLEIVDDSLLNGLWLSQTEFQDYGVSIQGYAVSDEAVVNYSEALKRIPTVAEVSIKQLKVGKSPGVWQFIIECLLSENQES